VDSCFALLGARQHCVARICNASQQPTHINCKMTRSLYQVPYFELTSYIFWLIRSLVDPTLAAFIVCGPLQFLVSHKLKRLGVFIPPPGWDGSVGHSSIQFSFKIKNLKLISIFDFHDFFIIKSWKVPNRKYLTFFLSVEH